MTRQVISVPGGPRAAVDARAQLTESFGGALASGRLADLHLLATEIVTNAVRHGNADHVELTIVDGPQRIRVEVRDDGVQGSPEQLEPSVERTGGFGLFLVEKIAASWGVEHRPRLVVWFELERA